MHGVDYQRSSGRRWLYRGRQAMKANRCSIDGCRKPQNLRGLCEKHYKRFLKDRLKTERPWTWWSIKSADSLRTSALKVNRSQWKAWGTRRASRIRGREIRTGSVRRIGKTWKEWARNATTSAKAEGMRNSDQWGRWAYYKAKLFRMRHREDYRIWATDVGGETGVQMRFNWAFIRS
jgi:hypothetical protein